MSVFGRMGERMISVVLAVRVIIVTALFFGIPIGLFLLHLYLSFRKKALWGLIAPTIWTLLSIWIISRSETYTLEMIIFCIAIDAFLFSIWGISRYIKNRKGNNN
jgi:hypothetical protein